MTAYLYCDESGNLDFSPNGTRFYGFGILTTRQQSTLTHQLFALRDSLLVEGLELEGFHAAEDKQGTRNRVFLALKEIPDITFDVLTVDKYHIPESARDHAYFYSRCAASLLRLVLQHHTSSTEPIVIVTDRLPLKKIRQSVAKLLKSTLREILGPDRPFTIVHHASVAHAGLQATDYCLWAVSRKWTRQDSRSYELIRPHLRSETIGDQDLWEEEALQEATPPAILSEDSHGLLSPGRDL